MKTMNKYLAVALSATLGLTAAFSCQKEIASPVAPEEEILETDGHFFATIGYETKTILDTLKVKWMADDSIIINGMAFVVDSIYVSDSTRAIFKQKVENKAALKALKAPYKAYFPTYTYNGGDPQVIPDTIKVPDVTRFDMPMYGESETHSISFENPFAVLAVSVSSDEASDISSVRVSEENSIRTMVYSPAVTTSSQGTILYVPVEPATYDSLNVYVTYAGGVKEMSTKAGKTITVGRNCLYDFNFRNTLKSVSLSKSSSVAFIGRKDTLTVGFAPVNATNCNYTFEVDDSSVASVVKTGSDSLIITGLKAGTATITVTSEEGSHSASCTLTVSPVPVSKVTLGINPTYSINDTLFMQKDCTLTMSALTVYATIEPSDATDQTVEWSVVEPTALCAASTDGNAISAGSVPGLAKIVVKSKSDASKADTCVLCVGDFVAFKLGSLTSLRSTKSGAGAPRMIAKTEIWMKKLSASPTVSIKWSSDGVIWKDLTISEGGTGSTKVTLNPGGMKAAYFRAGTDNVTLSADSSKFNIFESTGLSLSVSGNAMTLLNAASPKSTLGAGSEYAFYGLMAGMSNLNDASGLELPASSLTTACYMKMFNGCKNLEKAPQLPATKLAKNCYRSMFGDCSKLETAPSLPADTLAENSYREIFRGCTGLKSVTMLATDISAPSCLYNWLEGVSTDGEFTLNTADGMREAVEATLHASEPLDSTVVLDCTNAANFRYDNGGTETAFPTNNHGQNFGEKVDFWLKGLKQYVFHGSVKNWGNSLNAASGDLVKLPSISGYVLTEVNVTYSKASADRTYRISDGENILFKCTRNSSTSVETKMDLTGTPLNTPSSTDRYLSSSGEMCVKFILTYTKISDSATSLGDLEEVGESW